LQFDLVWIVFSVLRRTKSLILDRTYGNSPKQNARCNNEEYYIKFPQGAPDFNLFTLELERVNGSIPEDRQILLSSNANGGAPGTKWICVNNPSADIKIRCDYDGTLEF
jgi:hypothetical protein